MPAGATTLAALAPATRPNGPTYAETTLDAANGNKFPNNGSTILIVRNTTAGAIVLDFFVDTPEGNEVKVMSRSIPGNGTANGIVQLGPFPPERYNEHNTTEAASTGQVIMKQLSAGALSAALIPLSKSLLH
jgi:hypothetical protein